MELFGIIKNQYFKHTNIFISIERLNLSRRYTLIMALVYTVSIIALTFSLSIISSLVNKLGSNLIKDEKKKDISILIWFSTLLIVGFIGKNNYGLNIPATHINISLSEVGILALFIYLFSLYSDYDVANTTRKLVFFVLIFPIGEEILFRGIIQSKAARLIELINFQNDTLWKFSYFVVISAFCFAITHIQYKNFKMSKSLLKQVLFAFMFGLYAGKIATYTNSIAYTVLIHSVANFSAAMAGRRRTKVNIQKMF